MRSSAKATIRQATPKQNTAIATLSAGPRAKSNKVHGSAFLLIAVGRILFAAMLAQAADAGGCHAEHGTRRHGGSAQFQRAPR